MTDVASLFDEDLSNISTAMPLLAPTRADFTVRAVERQTDDKGDRLKITLNSVTELPAHGSGEKLSNSFPHNATLFLSGENQDAVKRDCGAWCQALGIKSIGQNGANLIGQTGKFNVTIKGEFNRFRPIPPNGK